MGLLNNLLNSFKMGNTPLMLHTGTEDTVAKSEPVQPAKAIIEDPLALLNMLGYKDKPSSLSYDTLRRMASRNSVVASIMQTRVNQVSNFSQPARFSKDGVGYEITLRDPKKAPSQDQMAVILSLEAFLENCGFSYDPGRDSFDTFLRKITRDSLTFDQATFEIVPDRLGRPAEMYAVDASTVRAAAIEPDEGEDYVTSTTNYNGDDWVQVLNGDIIAQFNSRELAFGIRNPRTDMNIQPYGFSELEILIHQITSHLWAEEYNSRYFSQGGTTKGILNLKGQNISKEQLDAFRRQWTAQIAGITGAWKTPVVSVEGIEYINVAQSNREMEYEMWMNYLINICCAVYQIDPSEINFPNRGGAGGGGGGLQESGMESRIKNSKDKGLRPLLRFLEAMINRHIIYKFSRDYTFNFVGLDKESEIDRLTLLDKEVRSFKTINEVRKEKDLDPIDGGDIILDPTYANYMTQQQQNEMMQQQGGEDGTQTEDGGQDEEQNPEEAQQEQEDSQISQSMDDQYGGTQ